MFAFCTNVFVTFLFGFYLVGKPPKLHLIGLNLFYRNVSSKQCEKPNTCILCQVFMVASHECDSLKHLIPPTFSYVCSRKPVMIKYYLVNSFSSCKNNDQMHFVQDFRQPEVYSCAKKYVLPHTAFDEADTKIGTLSPVCVSVRLPPQLLRLISSVVF